MGGDGGSIPGRADVVRVKGYGFKRNLGGMGYDPNTLVYVGDGSMGEDERRRLRFSRCFLSEEELALPVVVDRKGNLLNKEALLRGLIDKTLPMELQHIRKLKDVKQVAPSKHKGAFEVWDSESNRLQCPITGNVANGNSDFYVNWDCGCFFSKKALTQIPTNSNQCPVCNKHTKQDLIQIVPRQSNHKKQTSINEDSSAFLELPSKPQKRNLKALQHDDGLVVNDSKRIRRTH
eukprot:Protomagalhaensia_wolfi_Nauph_80__1326@NODE_1791_length_1337_cov_9_334361_g1395_i0_p1_GENE_NODE_1791_length_1337_cov_9_334361_g1395_i0NODE_1791_length_1337_cov_9_334361_g1395_i0_p1_ORF_typecomplete_len234_score48_54Rtf2/PF04641_12/1_1e43zfNse/PF11789_8/1_8e03zfNse/PF11789_8/0_0013zfRING_2/PF13639_6/0_0062Pellino/PF04710_14/0_041zfC3HC4_3/PF13920_6/0_32zfC3HC4_2/PF13923_6/1_4_NODE_1791_length_1337_cov_9_334361_g1395_i05771278